MTPLAVVARAVVLALREHPALNSSWDEATDEVVTKHYVNLGIAVAGPRGPGRAEHQGRAGPDAARADRGACRT